MKNVSHPAWWLFLVLLLVIPSAAVENNGATLSLATLRQSVLANEAKASLLRMECRLVAHKNGGPSRPAARRGSSEERYTHTQLMYAQEGRRHHLTEASYRGEIRGFYRVQVVDANVYKSAILPDRMEGWIQPTKSFQWGMIPPICFAFRPFQNDILLSDCLTSEFATLRPGRVTMGGRDAAVVEIRYPGRTFLSLAWIDPERGVVLRQEERRPEEDQVKGEAPAFWEEASRFHQLPNGGWLPVEGNAKMSVMRGGSLTEVTNQWTVDVNSVSIDKKDIPDSLFDIRFPPGAKVTVRGGVTAKPTYEEPASLIGKPLPSTEDFGIRPESYKDHRVLLCFFDASQRPSRSIVTTLGKKAAELRQKGVMVVAIQQGAAGTDERKVWLKEQPDAMCKGFVKGDGREVMFSWGVKGLPWLILADENHTVTAEGFGIDDLDAKLQQGKP